MNRHGKTTPENVIREGLTSNGEGVFLEWVFIAGVEREASALEGGGEAT
jgi:hypothetical protein